MADRNSASLTTLTDTTIASGDLIPVFDISSTDTKAITKANLDKSVGTVVDSVFKIADNSDNTKLVQFQASGLTTGTTRTLTVPDANTTIVGTATAQTLTNKTIDPSANTMDGDVLDITFTPTNYTPTTTGVAEASDVDDLAAHFKGIDNKFATGFTKQVFVPVSSSTVAAAGSFAPYTNVAVGVGQLARFNFFVPTDYTSLTSAQIILIGNSNTSIQYDLSSFCATLGEAYNVTSSSLNNQTLAQNTGQLSAISASGVLASIAAGDFVGLQVSSDIATLQVLGLLIKYA